MAFYDQHSQHSRQQSWEPSQGPSGRTGAPTSPEDSNAFRQQFEEIERAHENLAKSGRYPPTHTRRESLPLNGPFMNQFPPQIHDSFARPDPQTWDARHTTDRAMPSRHHSGSDFDVVRGASSPSSVQGFLQNQRFGGPRQSEAEVMMQAKRRAAAARERELRNYHQQQQFNRAQPGAKAERAMSPTSSNEEDRRELLQQQHRALYGENARLYDSQIRPTSQDARVVGASPLGNGHPSPMPFDSFRQAAAGASNDAMLQPLDTSAAASRSRSDSTSSKSANPPPFAMFDGNLGRTSNASPSDVAAGTSISTSTPNASVGPIGTRLPPGAAVQAKRGTPPMPSPLGHGFSVGTNDRTAPSATSSTPSNGNANASGNEKPGSGLGWGAGSGPWGSSNKSTLGQASVWG